MGVWGAGLQGRRNANKISRRAETNVAVEEIIGSEEGASIDGGATFQRSSEIDGTWETVNLIPPENTQSSRNKVSIDDRVDSIKTEAGLALEYNLPGNECFRIAVNRKYKELAAATDKRSVGDFIVDIKKGFDINKLHPIAAKIVYNRDPAFVKSALRGCLESQLTKQTNDNNKNTSGDSNQNQPIKNDAGGPFDKRMYRTYYSGTSNDSGDLSAEIRIPFSVQSEGNELSATSGLIAGNKTIRDSEAKDAEALQLSAMKAREILAKDNFYIGSPALQNTYAITKLYGSDGGKYLMNKRNERRWYEVDRSFTNGRVDLANYSSNPTTSSLILWGNGDPYGRTPYHFTDFVFSKYWNKIENNRLITLRRYGAPIVDNLKFPGMDGVTKTESPTDESTVNSGSSGKVTFPPMASAITYFGEETGNSLNSLLKFSTGVKWDEATSDVWQVRSESTPDSQSGPSGLYGGIGKLSKMLAVAGGNFDPQLLMNEGNLPPDPYSEGPYENRILGPVNRIDSVKKRAPGLEFEWSGLNIQFEYVSRPVGGVNPKAAILDILSNFLVLGSASAVFFGGQHRFMTNPAQYPFLGGDKGVEAWYSGKPLKYAQTAIQSFSDQAIDQDGAAHQNAASFFNDLFKGGGFGTAIKGLFLDGGLGSNIIKSRLAEKSAGAVPYLSGLKALLTGEPVGEWHVTIGNPLNPIAMIGNLICKGVEVEFNDELGPDDFPTEVKFTVKLDHGMPRDRDAIQSIFNRGMGRIYDLPDEFDKGSQTTVDANTQDANETGQPLAIKGWLAGPSKLGGRTGETVIKENAMGGSVSVWNRAPFQSVSPNQSILNNGQLVRSGYRQADWVAIKSLK